MSDIEHCIVITINFEDQHFHYQLLGAVQAC